MSVESKRRLEANQKRDLVLTTEMTHPDGKYSELFGADNLMEDGSTKKFQFVVVPCISVILK